jgi:putative oxidoreductase
MTLQEDTGKLTLRLTLGILILLHGIAKVTGGLGFVTHSVTSAGLPAFLAYGAYLGEVLAPVLVIIGLYSRIGAWIIAINMLFALFLVHRAELFSLNQTGGWAIELQAMFLFGAVAVALIGPGRYAANSR